MMEENKMELIMNWMRFSDSKQKFRDNKIY